ncbi:MAG: valine--tRNA ligase [Pirellulales bacterium]|nr:valine--tRNA ligase [Pirellulales bacterium]
MSIDSNSPELPKQYDHQAAQERWYKFWEEKGYFHSKPNPNKKPYCIVIPPPNVTGALHLGHALNNTLQDILIRQKRMQGFETLWMPGTDHAGIATQAVVERRLLTEEKITRHDLGREGLVVRIWEWKKEYEARILGQLKRMGCSCDWQRTRFTLDDTCARAVRETFFKLFKDGKIYRGKRLVNWDTFLQTAVSDDEVFHETVDGHFWYFKYPIVPVDNPLPGEPTHVTVATTRPETMLGDTAVAVHPDPAAALEKAEAELIERLAASQAKDKPSLEEQIEEVRRRKREMLPLLLTLRDMALAGREVMLPLQNKAIPLVADDWAKPELGTGCVKITPAHDANDYEVGLRKNLPMVNILNPDGTLSAEAGKYQGLTIMEAREKVVADLQALDLVPKIEDRQIEIAHSDRSKTPIEPYLTDQWFVKMDELAQSAMDAVIDGRVKIIPERYGKSYLDWLSEKRDWPIGRQLWWGHRIPVWTFTYGEVKSIDTDEPIWSDEEIQSSIRGWLEDMQLTDQVVVQDSPGRTLICTRSPQADQAFEELTVLLKNFDAKNEEEYAQRSMSGVHLLQSCSMIDRESDVLDTWFSSALWPHSTMGWPEQTEELKYYYPTNVLITSRDIITLWVARMVLTGLYNVGEIPFHEVFIHPKILDGYGEGMSKSKGNGVDPLDVIDKFGADALRFGIAYLTTETQDIRMPVEFECPHCGKLIEQTKDNRVKPKLKCKECGKEFSTQWAAKPEDMALPRGAVVSDRFELARNFCNKLWNASRFAMMNFEGFSAGKVSDEELFVEDKWILSRLATVTKGVTDALAEYRYADAARVLYDFAWDEFCSFYVEMVKGRLQSELQRTVAQRVLAHTLDTLLRLLHPMIPFLTEEVWQRLGEYAPRRALGDHHPAAESIMIAPWPEYDPKRQNPEIEARFAHFQDVLRAIRDIRSRQNVPPKTDLRFSVRCDAATAALLKPMEPYFDSMAGAKAVAWGPDVVSPELSANVSLSGMEVYVDLAGLIDIAAEIARKKQEIEKLAGFIAAKEKKLGNTNFVDRAPADVVQKERESLADLQSQLAAAKEVLERLEKNKA